MLKYDGLTRMIRYENSLHDFGLPILVGFAWKEEPERGGETSSRGCGWHKHCVAGEKGCTSMSSKISAFPKQTF